MRRVKNPGVSSILAVSATLVGACGDPGGTNLDPPRASPLEPQNDAMLSTRTVRVWVDVKEGYPDDLCVTVYDPHGDEVALNGATEVCRGPLVTRHGDGAWYAEFTLPAGRGTAFEWSVRRTSCIRAERALGCDTPEKRWRFFVPAASSSTRPAVTVGQVTDMNGDGEMDLVYEARVGSPAANDALRNGRCSSAGDLGVCETDRATVVIVPNTERRYELLPMGRLPGENRARVLLLEHTTDCESSDAPPGASCTTQAWLISRPQTEPGAPQIVVHSWTWHGVPAAHRTFRGGRDLDRNGFFDLVAYGSNALNVCYAGVPAVEQGDASRGEFVCLRKNLPQEVEHAPIEGPPKIEFVPQEQPGAPPRLIAAFKVEGLWQVYLGTFSLTRSGAITWAQDGRPIEGLQFDGRTLRVPADVDHDGHRDLVLTVSSPTLHRGAVEAWSLRGAPQRIGNTLAGETADFGHAISGGDTNDDGFDELYIGEPSHSILRPGRIHRYEWSDVGLVRVWWPDAPGSLGRLLGASFTVLPGRGLVAWPGSLPRDPNDDLSLSDADVGLRNSGAILDLNRYPPIDTADR